MQAINYKKRMYENMDNRDEVIKIIREGDNFLLSTHINPDGDGIGSMLAMGWILKKLNKTYALVIDSAVPDVFSFLAGAGDIISYSEGFQLDFTPHNFIGLDIPNLERVERVNTLIPPQTTIINIDHHCSNHRFGNVNLLDFDASSCAEIMFRVVEAFGFPLDRDIAEDIYTGVVIDTGRFRFANTTAGVLRIASTLVGAGARADFIAERLFYTCTLETIQGLKEVLSSIELSIDGRFAISFLSREFLERIDNEKMETEGFVNYALSVEGVQVAVLLRDEGKGGVRGSLRSSVDHIDVNLLAEKFNGGGHKRAAGFRTVGTVEEVKQNLIRELKKIV